MKSIPIYILNLKHRPDRRIEIEQELSDLQIMSENIKFIESKYTPRNGAIGCAVSHAYALSKYLYEDNAEYCIVFEDDAVIPDKKYFLDSLTLLQKNPFKWDVVLLAHNAAIAVNNTAINNLHRVINAQTTSAYIVNRNFAPTLIKCFYESAQLQSENLFRLNNQISKHFYALDMYWKKLQHENDFLAFFPSLTVQRQGYSDIEEQSVNYGV